MDISHIEHVGIAVPSLDEAIPFYENMLGLKCFAIEEVADQKVRTAFFRVGQTKIELLEPTAEDSAIAKFIANNGGRGGIQHIAFAVADGVANALAGNRGERRPPDRQGAPQGSRGSQHSLHTPEIVGGHSGGTLRGSRQEVTPQEIY